MNKVNVMETWLVDAYLITFGMILNNNGYRLKVGCNGGCNKVGYLSSNGPKECLNHFLKLLPLRFRLDKFKAGF